MVGETYRSLSVVIELVSSGYYFLSIRCFNSENFAYVIFNSFIKEVPII